MAVTITIRNVPTKTHDELAERAARSGRSLQAYLRAELIALADKPTPSDLMARIHDRKKATRTGLSTKTILGHRDADRG